MIQLPYFHSACCRDDSIAAEYGLRLECDLNFHAFFAAHCQQPDLLAHLRRGRALDPRTGAVPQDAWDIAYFYRVFVFRKDGLGAALKGVAQAQAQMGDHGQEQKVDPRRMEIRRHSSEDIVEL